MTIVMQQKATGSGDVTASSPQPPVQGPQPAPAATAAATPAASAASDATPSQSSVTSPPAETGQGDAATGDATDEEEPDFPHATLAKLDDMINRPRWVVPVLPKGELEVLLEASIGLCKRGLDTRSEACQRFFREGLTVSFNKVLTDEAVNGWKYEIHKYILRNCEKLVELSVSKLNDDWFPLLDLLAIVFNPQCKFHMYNAARQSESVPNGSTLAEDELFARPVDSRNPRGWLVDLLNLFGQMDGFQIIHDRFVNGGQLSVSVIASLTRPFGHCSEVLTTHTVQKYFMPVVDIVPKFLDQLTDTELKKESKGEAKNDALSCIIKALKLLVARVANQDETIKNLEIFRLKMILRLLQISSFNGKMNALNEVNKVIANVSFQSSRHSQMEEDEWLTAEKMAEWIQQNNVLSIVLRDSLHQPQYVEKLEKILRFMIKEKALTVQDLDKIWEAQAGKHEAIVKNVHDLLAKLAWDFSAEQLDHLFECFQASWVNATKKQREKLLELIRRLAEDDKEGVMAHKVLGLLWNLAHNEDVPTEIMDQALSAHQKILDYSCSQDRDAQKMQWINKFVEELKNEKWVLPALKQIREICQLFQEAPQSYPHNQRSSQVLYRNSVINQLQNQHSIVMLVAQNLAGYMAKAKASSKEDESQDPTTIFPDGRFNHVQQVQERLKFLRFLLKDGQLWLCDVQAKQIWNCLAVDAVCLSDREACFKWFAKLMGDEPDLDPEITRDFFENHILQLDPSLLTENGMNCFERFFRHENLKEGKLAARRRGGFLMDDLELIGLDYLWRVVLYSPDEVANKAITLLKDTYTNLGPRLQRNQVEIHEDFVQSCTDRLKASYDTVTILEKDKESVKRMMEEAKRMVRVLTVLKEYVAECDDAHGEERTILPLSRACRGKLVVLVVRFPSQGRQSDDLEVWSHTNDTIGGVRRQILQRVKANNANLKLELYINGELLDPTEDKRLVSHMHFRDKTVITAKLLQAGSNLPSSPDSSSDSSAGSPHNGFDGPNVEVERCLPGVIMSKNTKYTQFLFQLFDMGSHLQLHLLRDTARQLLQLMPADIHITEKLKSISAESAKINISPSPSLEAMFYCSSAAQCFYCLEVTYSLLMPAQEPMSDEAFEFQHNFVKSGGIAVVLTMLTKNNFLSTADIPTKRTVYLNLLRISKLLLTTVCHAKVQVVADACHGERRPASITPTDHSHAILLQQALHQIPNHNSEFTTRSVAMRLGQHLGSQVSSKVKATDITNTIKSLQKLVWCSSSGALQLLHASSEDMRKSHTQTVEELRVDNEYVLVAKEALEVLTISLALCPSAMDSLHNNNKSWQCFIIDMLILCKTRCIRVAAADQFFLIATKCSSSGDKPVIFFILLLFTVLLSTVVEHAKQSHEYFQLLCRLLNYACAKEIRLSNADIYLNNEIGTLKEIRAKVLAGNDCPVEESILEGHLSLCKELLAFQTHEQKFNFGSEKGGANLIKELVEDFIFPASKIVIQCRKLSGELPADNAVPVCTSPQTVTAAFDLLVSLCTGCLPNLRCLVDMLVEMYYKEETVLVEWEYLPPVGPRPSNGFVGLKNAGATCYMNSLLQQLFMIEPIRVGILAVEGAADDVEDDYMDEKGENEITNADLDMNTEQSAEETRVDGNKQEERKDYNMGVLKHVQVIFGYLSQSKLQYYVPQGFWKHFKLWGEPVNLREQHDALEFFNSLVDSLDEAMKSLGQEAVLSQVLGGSFADQKICKGCPHRYQKEEEFTSLNVDIRNHHNLKESLEQYVKGDLLEGANAYHCEKCNKKVDTVKRMVIKKLPKILAIQLKRFDYDWERECAIKFNDYFEFPREIDMEPYAVQGLAKIEGEVIDGDDCDTSQSTKYRLVGVVVHSGQASGGHYYSYILHRAPGDTTAKWYKFDDGEVSECKMDDDEEMKNQCFGGEYMGEVFDHMLKRRQKRWWNAYILMYEREDTPLNEVTDHIATLTLGCKMPSTIERCVRKQNILFMHDKNQFSVEYFQFVRKLLLCNAPYVAVQSPQEKLSLDAEEIAMYSVQLASKFLFTVGFHTKKNLRGPANEWYEALSLHLRNSKAVRSWFSHHVLFDPPGRFAEYLLECPSSEVRSAFAKIVVFVAHFTLHDGPCAPPLIPGLYTQADPTFTLSDHLLVAVLNLLKKDISDHGRHVQQYFHLFLMYANLGVGERQQLLKLHVPANFMLVALDEGSAPPIKYQFTEFNKLYSAVSLLVRCCDVSQRCQSSSNGTAPLPNPHGEAQCPPFLMTVPPTVADILFVRTSYVKKLIEDCNSSEDTTKLLRFCCWENPHFSSVVLSELLWQVAYSYTYELRPYLDLLLQMLLVEDSWQNHRIHNALRGIPDDRDGLFDTIHRSKNHYQKRAYQCIKMMVSLFSHCVQAAHMLHTNGELKRKWAWAVEWLNDELERRPHYPGNSQYSYNNWSSPPAQSNETSNGYFLERSNSARMTLDKAMELCPEEEPEESDVTDDQDNVTPDDPVTTVSHSQTMQPSTSRGHPTQSNNQASTPPTTTTTTITTTQPAEQLNNLVSPQSQTETETTEVNAVKSDISHESITGRRL